MRCFLLVLLLVAAATARAQYLGGQAAFPFLQLPNGPQLTAHAGAQASGFDPSLSWAAYQPAFLHPGQNAKLEAVFNSIGGLGNALSLAAATYHEKLKTSFGAYIHYLDYGTIDQTDPGGNSLGSFRPGDWMVQIGAGRSYGVNWQYGANIKFIHSAYGIYRASALALDFGVLYTDTSQLLNAGLLIRNLGGTVKNYTATPAAQLPFDLQLSVSRRIGASPFAISLTAHHLHQFDIRFRDPLSTDQGGAGSSSGKSFFDNLFRHFNLSGDLFLTDKLQFSLGYNHLRRRELNFAAAGNGLNGFSAGAALLTKNWQFRYAISYYQRNVAFQQVGIGLNLASGLIR